MAYRASPFYKGNSRLNFPSGFHAGAAATILFTHVFDVDALANTDVLELMPLPAGAKLVALTYASENLPAGNATIGLMSGTPGDVNDTRTGGSELVSAVAHATTDAIVPIANLIASAMAVSQENRSISFKTSATISVAANRKLHVRATFQF